jgi:dTMP kinase
MKRFVTFEGIDGCGKSTISKKVYERLKGEGVDVVLTFEPTDSYIGRFVQRCIKEQGDPFVTAFTFIADRIQHSKLIGEWLDDGKVVLCDRYAESTYAYQGAQLEDYLENPIRWLQDLSKNILVPDRTFLFVLDPKVSLMRIEGRNDLIPFERVSFLKKVQEYYLKVCKGRRFLRVDATMEIEEIVDLCLRDIFS